MDNFLSNLAEYNKYFNKEIPSLFLKPHGLEKQVVEAMSYSLECGGKRIRPYLVAETALLFGINKEQSFMTAAAIESLHTYSLIHDDLPAMDNDDLRRGKPTCHKQFDEATAILAGDGLLTYAFELISSKKNPFSAEIKCQLINLLARYAGAFNGMIAGQMLDLLSHNFIDDENLELIINQTEEMKTGKLLRFACESGAVMGQADEKEHQALTIYSRKIGAAFQIVDDILDIEGKPELMGKTLGKDIAQNKLTFVRLYGIEQAKQIAKTLIDDAINAISIFGNKAQNLDNLACFILNRQS